MAEQLRPQFGEHGSLQQLFWGGKQWLEPWGLEMADSRSFFSLETGGWQNSATILNQSTTQTEVYRQIYLDLYEGKWQIDWAERVLETAIERTADFTSLTDAWSMDFVMRFAFARSAITHAEIARKTVLWDGSNYYHQYPVQSVKLFHAQGEVTIQVDEAFYPNDWQQVIYVRCSPNENAWIVHVRLLPKAWSREIIKLRLIGARHLLLPSLFGHLLKLWPRLEAYLRYAGEYKRFNFGRINAIPMNFVKRHTQFSLTATVHFLGN